MIKKIDEIQFEKMPGKNGDIGLITLTRQQVLNALNHTMFLALDENLAAWQQDKSIKAIVIRAAEGRAFCAGGDIRHAYEMRKKNDETLPHFFRDEYRMNSRIHHYPKPFIALLDGITMGGGVGISIHGSHRIGTPRLTFAMPETGIGFYPDVGTTYYLARFPYKMGYYLGLTGVRINYADCLAIGIVQEIVASESLSAILTALSDATITDNESVTNILKPFSISVPDSELMKHRETIEKCFAKNSVEEILHALENESDEWSQQTAALLKTKSPTSLKVTFEALRHAAKMNFDESQEMEYGMTLNFIREHDFFEGIRAVIIDKDQKPKWKPATLKEVTPDMLENYFMPSALRNDNVRHPERSEGST